uniref:Uncharacterized protein VVUP4 n=1 Tax=Volvariella volvacea TaxID=36659 RepID=H6VLD9_9AGAR|nr:hypothetical protein [Volvariella volvacea]
MPADALTISAKENVSKTGGQEYNSPYNAPSGQYGGPSINHDEAINSAKHHGSGDSSLFSTALSFLGDHKSDHEKPLDEASVTKAHQTAYSEGGASKLSASALGSAAALQVLKQFTSGSGSGQSNDGGSKSMSTQLISMAMAEATKLFDKSGGAASGNKQDAVNGAAMTVMKLLVQSKFGGSGSTTGGPNSGGLSSLLGLASQFKK